MTTRPPRVLFVGLDAMDHSLVSRWVSDGRLPAFARLLETGVSGGTRNPPGLFVGAVWPSFFTGVSPTRHGRYCYEQLVPGTYGARPFQASDLAHAPFWRGLSAAGRRVAVVDVPKSPLTPGLDGLQVVDWGTHDPDLESSFSTWPPALAAEIATRFGSDPVGDCNRIGRGGADVERFCRNLEARIAAKTEMCLDLLGRGDWDLFLAVFAESHCVGHQCWNIHDPGFEGHDPVIAAAVGDPLLRVYTALDAALARLLEYAGPDTTTIVLASHGMGPHYDATFMLDDILERLDPRPGAGARWWFRRTARYWRAVLRRVWFGDPLVVPLGVGPRRFFAVPNNDVHGAIRVNLAGREPRGLVRPGAELEAVYEELRRGLLDIVNADTGQPLVRALHRFADAYPGEDVSALPDFYVEWNREVPVRRIRSPAIGVVEDAFRGVRNGDHTADGKFWAAGPRIDAGHEVDPVQVVDFAATVAALLDVELPDIDGRPIGALTR